MPQISIIVPIYNAANTLRRCIDSVLVQTFYDFELLLIDDGSTDESWEICLAAEEMDNRVIAIKKVNGGVSQARNVGLQNANGKWLTFIDSDDYINPDMLSSMIKIADKDAMIVCCSSKYSNGKDFFVFKNSTTIEKSQDEIGLVLLFGAPFAKLFDNNILKKYNIYFNEKLSKHEDTVFFWEYMKYAVSISTTSYIGYVYNVQNSTLSLHNQTVPPELLLSTFQILDDEYKQLRTKYLIHPVHDNRISTWLSSFILQALISSYKLFLSKKERFFYWKLVKRTQKEIKYKIPTIWKTGLKIHPFLIADLYLYIYMSLQYYLHKTKKGIKKLFNK